MLSHDDLLSFTKKVVEKYPVILKKIRDKYQLVFIDEYQDTDADVLRLFYSSMVSGIGIILYYRGIRVGRITLKYKTWIQGGRPQFLYDSFYLSNPVLEDGWTLMDANVTFSGDKITVYIACFSGSDHDKSWVYFDPY